MTGAVHRNGRRVVQPELEHEHTARSPERSDGHGGRIHEAIDREAQTLCDAKHGAETSRIRAHRRGEPHTLAFEQRRSSRDAGRAQPQSAPRCGPNGAPLTQRLPEMPRRNHRRASPQRLPRIRAGRLCTAAIEDGAGALASTAPSRAMLSSDHSAR